MLHNIDFRRILHLTTLALVTGLSSIPLNAQSWRLDLQSYFDDLQTGGNPFITEKLLSDLTELNTLSVVYPFLNDSNDVVQMKGYELVARISLRSRDNALRKDGVELLARSCLNNTLDVVGMAIQQLRGFQLEDFTESAKDDIRKSFRKQITYRQELTRLIAFLQLSDMIPEIQSFSKSGNSSAIRWSAIVSLARLGDESAASEMMMRVRRLPVNDDVVYNLFPDLIFSRNPAAIKYLTEVLQSDEKNCQSADAEKAKRITCAYRVMELLAPIIDELPVELDEAGDVVADSYPGALEAVRQWFRTNKQYVIATNEY